MSLPVDTSKTIAIDTAVSDTVSSWVRLPDGQQAVGLEFPATLASTAVTFYSRGSGTPLLMQDSDGAAYAPTVAVDTYLPLKVQVFAGVTEFRVVFGSAEADETTVRVRTRPV